ncbi:MAG: hypothetical protein IPI63_11330 [Methanothrix sp.]|uniref:hypothetical protein n=1 Tax=Methanothrix sp. TaxID=90426 RepID=UPI001BD60C3E|nr:hypothetical protein [Methanothrix sp.]MBK7387265.1 hypothetical protein [Methanothrix sp.]
MPNKPIHSRADRYASLAQWLLVQKRELQGCFAFNSLAAIQSQSTCKDQGLPSRIT